MSRRSSEVSGSNHSTAPTAVQRDSDSDQAAGAPRTAQPKAEPAAHVEAAKVEKSRIPDQKEFGLSQEVEGLLVERGAYVWKKDDRGNLLIRSTKQDKESPRNWPNWKRYGVVILASTLNNLVCICASGYSTGVEQMQEEFGFSSEVGTVGLSLYVLGFAVGPMLLAPLSEYFGRRRVYLVSWFIFTCFQIPLALAQNLQTILVCRFIQGFTGSAPLANTGGVVHDIFGVDEGGMAVGIYALSSADGPPFGNVVSGYLAQEQGWRWLFWAYLIIFGAFLVVIYLFLPETRDTILLSKKSADLRQQTNDMPFYAEHELVKKDPRHLWAVTLVRPFKFLVTEPITYLNALINGFVFGVIFISNEAFPLVFGPDNNGHGWTHSGTVNLTFGAYVIGAVIGFLLQPLQESAYRRGCKRLGSSDPEARWWSALWGTPFIPLGLMVAAWTSYARIVWVAPFIGFVMVGFGFYIILAAILNYIVDGYGHYSASALGAVVFIRNIAGAGFPLFAAQMFKGVGNQWALFILSMVSFLMVPIPLYFYWRGKTVRQRSPYCATHFGQE